MKKSKYWAILIILICLILAFSLLTGGKKRDVYLNNFTVADDNNSILISVNTASSAGYIRTFNSKREGTDLYLTFYSTFGLNNSIGAKDSFSIDLDGNYENIYFYRGDDTWELILTRDEASGSWQRAA